MKDPRREELYHYVFMALLLTALLALMRYYHPAVQGGAR